MEKVVLEANERKIINKSSRSHLRNQGKVPGVLYSKRLKPIHIDVNRQSINPLIFTAQTHLISLKIEGQEERECIIKDIQFDPVTDEVIHFDLISLTKGEKIELEVPLHFTGSAIGVKEGGLLQVNLHKLNVECLPKDIPQSLEIDVAQLKVGDSIHIRDLQFESVTILNPEGTVVVSVVLPKVEKEVTVAEGEEVVEEEMAEPEVIGKGKDTEEEDKEKE